MRNILNYKQHALFLFIHRRNEEYLLGLSAVLLFSLIFMNNVQNTFCWIDIPVINLDRAIGFYQQLLNAEVQKIAEHGFEFGLLPHVQDNVSGCLAIMPDRQPSQQGPLVYLNAEGRLKEALQAVESNGGKILNEIEQIGPYGHRVIILDSEGNAIALYSKVN